MQSATTGYGRDNTRGAAALVTAYIRTLPGISLHQHSARGSSKAIRNELTAIDLHAAARTTNTHHASAAAAV